MNNNEPRQRGLSSINQGREQRKAGKFTRLTPRLTLSLVTAFIAIIIVYGAFAKRSLDKSKNELLGKRRAVEAVLGPEWFPLRDKLEKLTTDTARDWPGEWVDSTSSKWDFRGTPGIYLRVRTSEARDVNTLREAAKGSVNDGFTACLIKGFAVPPAPGGDGGTMEERMSKGLASWNLRQAYASTRVLTDPWISEVKEASDDLRLRVFEQQFDIATKKEIPLAVDIVKRAQYFLLVLDEDAAAALEKTDGGPLTHEAIMAVPHDARIRVWNLKTGAEIARVKRRAEAGVRFVGEQAIADPEARDAVQRQVNSCALANRLKEAVGFP